MCQMIAIGKKKKLNPGGKNTSNITESLYIVILSFLHCYCDLYQVPGDLLKPETMIFDQT